MQEKLNRPSWWSAYINCQIKKMDPKHREMIKKRDEFLASIVPGSLRILDKDGNPLGEPPIKRQDQK